MSPTSSMPGLAAALLLAGAACEDSGSITDLHTQGPPEVLTVAVPSEGEEPSERGHETAIYCQELSQGRIVNALCEAGAARVTDVVPMDWKVRIVFDELLAASAVETLEIRDVKKGVLTGHIDQTEPVRLRCDDNDVPYDGYYDPTGNAFTAVPGPGLVVTLKEGFAGTSRTCTIAIDENVVTDKDGNPVPAGQLGPYQFQLASFRAITSAPVDGTEQVPVDVVPRIEFNAPIATSQGGGPAIPDGAIVLTDAQGRAVAVTYRFAEAADKPRTNQLELVPSAPLAAGAEYRLQFTSAADQLTDAMGGKFDLGKGLAAQTIQFTTAQAGGGQ